VSERRSGSGADPAEKLWYSPSASAAAARAALAPLSLVFGAGVRIRSELFERGFATVEQAPAPVVSVGSLRVGGAGKTPFVLWLARELGRRGRRPCIVTRGYGGTASAGPWLLDRAGASLPDAAARAGDEAVLLALRSGTPVAIGSDRARACACAAAELAATPRAPDVFVLDDGFQHRRLARALDIVLVSGGEADERLLPAGPLREPVSALARADAVVTMNGSMDEALRRARDCRSHGRSKGVESFARAIGIVGSVADTEAADAEILAGRRVLAVAAIARPERFLETLREKGADVAGTVLRRDHHRYSDEDRRQIDAASGGVDFVVTTEKDMVRLAGASFRAPLVALRIEIGFADEASGRELADRAASLAPI
jgi:tetraacyldisaccharide 4'-kinase